MQSVVIDMLAQRQCQTIQDYSNALKEIIQEIALLGLWRAKFFEHAAFYGGTALRILYGLDRFSEDLDFSLLKTDPHFKLTNYQESLQEELLSFGFNSSFTFKEKKHQTAIQSAFIKTNTKEQFLKIEPTPFLARQLHHQQSLQIKIEIDTDPPGDFETEAKVLLEPIPFSVNTFTKPCLFAGKLHALLCRAWQNRIKGRDWYDFVWYLKNKIPVNLKHLKARLVQSGHFPEQALLDSATLKQLLEEKIQTTDFTLAQKDVSPFILKEEVLSFWSPSFFLDLLRHLQAETA